MSEFEGFSSELVDFYTELRHNNNRAWFNEYKEWYLQKAIVPAQAFVKALGTRLRVVSPGVVSDTRTNGSGSIQRIYRDVRFSKDKSPFKTFLGIYFWEGPGKKFANSGFYLHLEPPNLMIGAGLYQFPKAVLQAYRAAVIDPKLGPQLAEAIQQVADTGKYGIGGQHYKRIPRDYPADHPYAALLRHNGLFASLETPIPDVLFSEELLDYCVDCFVDTLPIHRWLVALTERVAPK